MTWLTWLAIAICALASYLNWRSYVNSNWATRVRLALTADDFREVDRLLSQMPRLWWGTTDARRERGVS